MCKQRSSLPSAVLSRAQQVRARIVARSRRAAPPPPPPPPLPGAGAIPGNSLEGIPASARTTRLFSLNSICEIAFDFSSLFIVGKFYGRRAAEAAFLCVGENRSNSLGESRAAIVRAGSGRASLWRRPIDLTSGGSGQAKCAPQASSNCTISSARSLRERAKSSR